MFSKNKTDWSLLAKELADETNEKEKQVVAAWLNESPENRALYKQIKSDWMMMDNMTSQFNVDNAWNKLHDRILAGEPELKTDTGIRMVQTRRSLFTPLRIAATLAFLALLGASVAFIANRSQKINITAAIHERGKNIVLPDGSSVILNGNSSIRYARNFNRKTREVKLVGEAFFEVSPDKDKPFRIYADHACIQVVGTSFNVDARREDHQVEVYVSTGMVELSEADNMNNKILLKPGNIGLLRNNAVTAKVAENENTIAWKTGAMAFYETRLSEVTSVLNDFFNVKIVIRENGVDSTLITGEYMNDPLDHILEVICKQNHLTVEKSDNMIYLSRQ
ncbi:MAG: FecR domain-containing protein [Bacteroidales bacterium]|nr:FecR domain-containing protein [Bacteroidales bacterium]